MGYGGVVLLRGKGRKNESIDADADAPADDPSTFDFDGLTTPDPPRAGNLSDFGLNDQPIRQAPPTNGAPADGSSDADRYSAWADRLRDKRARNQATILGSEDDAETVTNWAADWVISGDDPVDDTGIVPDQMRRGRLLSELGLESGATSEQITLAYRALAKVHHPDRWVDADEAVQLDHAEQMLRVNAVYRALRSEVSL